MIVYFFVPFLFCSNAFFFVCFKKDFHSNTKKHTNGKKQIAVLSFVPPLPSPFPNPAPLFFFFLIFFYHCFSVPTFLFVCDPQVFDPTPFGLRRGKRKEGVREKTRPGGGESPHSFLEKKIKTNLKVMFKTGDDLRQDQLVIQIITLMDRLLKRVNLDLMLMPYGVLAISPSHGKKKIF